VKGRSEPEAIHELLGDTGYTVATYAGLPGFADGMAAYRRGDFAGARRAFEAFAAANPQDHVAQEYLSRLADLGDAPPPDWDGVTVHAQK
jgi:adenylate cyclase